MKFYFVRHGKTQWNLEGRFQGAHGDSPLLEESIRDLEKLGDYLKDIKFDNDIFNAESLYQTIKRVEGFIRSMKDQPYQHVLLVGHGANFTASIRSLLGYEPAVLRSNGGLDNGSVTIIETFDFDQYTCIKWNDTYYKEK